MKSNVASVMPETCVCFEPRMNADKHRQKAQGFVLSCCFFSDIVTRCQRPFIRVHPWLNFYDLSGFISPIPTALELRHFCPACKEIKLV